MARDEKVAPAQYGSDLWHSRWCHNVFQNYPILSKSYGARFLHESCKGMTAFVVGVGPSLDESIKDLKAAKGRSVIISTDAALRALLANGITPDLVISYDCKEDQKRLWEGVTAKISGLFNSCAHAKSIESWPGPILFYNQYHTQDELCQRILPDVLPELGQIPSAGTVGTMAVMAAHLMGCDPICCVGMDFCYAQDGKGGWQYRAQDYQWVHSQPDKGLPGRWEPTEIKELYDNDERVSRSFEVKDESGAAFKSDPELKWYLQSFVNLCGHFKVPVVNCSPLGLIPSTIEWGEEDIKPQHVIHRMTVADAILQFCKAPHQDGRTVLAHLDKIVPDARKL